MQGEGGEGRRWCLNRINLMYLIFLSLKVVFALRLKISHLLASAHFSVCCEEGAGTVPTGHRHLKCCLSNRKYNSPPNAIFLHIFSENTRENQETYRKWNFTVYNEQINIKQLRKCCKFLPLWLSQNAQRFRIFLLTNWTLIDPWLTGFANNFVFAEKFA